MFWTQELVEDYVRSCGDSVIQGSIYQRGQLMSFRCQKCYSVYICTFYQFRCGMRCKEFNEFHNFSKNIDN